ncbi:MAG: DUF3516 domain-containing protein, partial [Polyangiaceae bacterium]
MSTPDLLSRLPAAGEERLEADEILERFLDYTSEVGLALYDAQQEAVLELLADSNVILNTPTGSGKSLVATALHFKAMCEAERSVYTSPIKALVNEKFFSLCEIFHADNVGLLTGDATINRDAPILCCTAEILANMSLRQGAALDLRYAVLDEFHFYGDRDRGVAWQIPLLTMPQTRFLLMSATLGDTSFFERTLTDLNGAPTALVRSKERPVPLDYSYQETSLHETVLRLIEGDMAPVYVVSFSQKDSHSEAQNLMSINVTSKENKRAIADLLRGFRFDSPYGKIIERFVRHGIGVHHGGMLPKYRRLVERLAQAGLLKVVSGTDTLGVGVNIPIRTVLLSKLCKFDGQQTRVLAARDFHQICGRAGRKGFDVQGSIMAQAPLHVIENLKLEAKASRDSSKKRKIHKKKPPSRGYVHYDRATFEKLMVAEPESLSSRFRVTHSMLLNVLSRDDGCAAMKKLIRGCHESPAMRRRHGRTAMQMFRSLVESEVITFEPRASRSTTRAVVNVELQREFSLNYSLSLFVYETVNALDPERETYALDVLSLVESILENPTAILRKQLDRIKTEAIARMKAEGIEYDERIQRLDELDYPKPNAEFIYAHYNDFAASHPWVGNSHIRPKSPAREMYEGLYDFRNFIGEYKLERSEGLVLRYLSDVYKTLTQNVPERARTESVMEMTDYFEGVVRCVDASLLEEWEKLRDPDYAPVSITRPAEPER